MPRGWKQRISVTSSVVIVLVLLFFVTPVSAQSQITISIDMNDNIVNPGQTITITGHADQGGVPLENKVVKFFLDNSRDSLSWTQTSQEDWNAGFFDNTTAEGGGVRLAYKWDRDIMFENNASGKISWVDPAANVDNVTQGGTIGGAGDIDEDGDMDVTFIDDSDTLKFVDSNGNENTLRSNVVGVGVDVGDIDNDGWLEVPFMPAGTNDLRYIDFNGEENDTGVDAKYGSACIGGIGDIDNDGDLDILYGTNELYPELRYVDAYGNDVSMGVDVNNTSDRAIGEPVDIDGDGDLDVPFIEVVPSGPYYEADLELIDDNGNHRILVSGGVAGIGGAGDFDGDGNIDLTFHNSSNEVRYVDNFENDRSAGVYGLVGSIVDFDGDTGYLPSGTYTTQVHDWRSPTVRAENVSMETNVPQSDLVALVQVSDDENFATIEDEDNLGHLGGGIESFDLSLPQAQYIRVKFYLTTENRLYYTPSVVDVTINANIYTDENGDYEHMFDAPTGFGGKGTHEARVVIENNGGSGENTQTFDVRGLEFDQYQILDNHGQVDGDLNPGENFCFLVRIREENSSQYYDVTSGNFTAFITFDSSNPNYDNFYDNLIYTGENSVWMTENSFIAPNSLATYHPSVDFSGSSSENIIGSKDSASYTYDVKTVSISINPDDSVVNPYDNITFSGSAILQPDGSTIDNENVEIYIDETYESTIQTGTGASAGDYEYTYQVSDNLGSHTASVYITNPQGIEGEDNTTYRIKTLTITITLDDNLVDAGRRVIASGDATLWPDNTPETGEQVEIWVGENADFENTKTLENTGTTDENGHYDIGFYAPENLGTMRALAYMSDSNNIENDNWTAFRVETIYITLSLSDNDVGPGDIINASGTATYQPSGNPVDNERVDIWNGKAIDSKMTDENGDYSYTFSAPTDWGRYEFTVDITSGGFSGENAENYEVNTIILTLNLDDGPGDVDDNILNSGQQLTISGNATLMPDDIPTAGGSVHILVNGGTYVDDYAGTDENGDYSYSFNAPNSLGEHSIFVEIDNSFSGQGTFHGENAENFEVRNLDVTVNLPDSKVDAGALTDVNGDVTLLPQSRPIVAEKVEIYQDDDKVGKDYTDSSGRYETQFDASDNVGPHTITAYCTDENGIENQGSTTLYVEKIGITVNFDDYVVNPGESDNIFGTATYLYSEDPVENDVLIYLDDQYQYTVSTDDNGDYSWSFNAPTGLGTHTIKVKISDQEFTTENSENFQVRSIQIPANLSDNIVEKNQLNITVSGTVLTQPEGWPVDNEDVSIDLDWTADTIETTDENGDYSYNFDAPGSLGTVGVSVNITDDNGITASNDNSLDVRELIFSDYHFVDNHGQEDNVLNPGENYRISTRIREYNGSQYWDVKAGSFSVTISGTPYSLSHVENGKWRMSTSRDAVTGLGPENITANFSGTSGHGISGSDVENFSYDVKTVWLSENFDDNIVNPNQLMLVSGKVISRPDNDNLSGENVEIWRDSTFLENVATDENGNYNYQVNAPQGLDNYLIKTRATTSKGIEMENSKRFWVKTIRISETIEVLTVAGLTQDNVYGYSTLLPDNTPVDNTQVKIFGSGISGELYQTTADNGYYFKNFSIPNAARNQGWGEVRVEIWNGENILGENAENYYTGTPVNIRGVLKNAENKPIPGTLTFESTSGAYTFQIPLGAEGDYEGIIIENEYNLTASVFQNEIRFENVDTFVGASDWENFDNLIRLDNIPRSATPIADNVNALVGMAIEPGENLSNNFDAGTLTIDYSSELWRVDDESAISIYKTGWDMSQREKTDNWGNLGGTVNKINHTVTLTGINSFSAYVAGEKVAPPLENVEGPVTGPVTGPIEGPIEGPLPEEPEDVSGPLTELQERISALENALELFENLPTQDPIELGPGAQRGVDLELYQGESTTVEISLRNNLDLPVVLIPEALGETRRYVNFQDPYLRLDPQMSGKLGILAYVPDNAETGLYTGSIKVTENLTGENLTEIPARIRVMSPAKSFLNLAINPLSSKVAPGENLSAEINLQNVGDEPEVSTTVTLQLIHLSTPTIVAETSENFTVETTLTEIMSLKVPENLEDGDYQLKALGDYTVKDNNQQATALSSVSVEEPSVPLLDRKVGPLPLAVLLAVAVAGAAAGTGGYLYYRRRKAAAEKKKRYEKVVESSELPQETHDAARIGKLAETDTDTYIGLNDMKTHMMVAGATGAGKTIMGQDLVEEALLKGVNVFVFDPTGQWSGFMEKCEQEDMLEHYSKFEMSEANARGFSGSIRIIHDPREVIGLGDLLEQEKEKGEEGKIRVFDIRRLESEDMDTFVANTINDVFKSNPQESEEIKALIVYDEVHRLLPRFGGKGLGITMLERAVREFRKWGIGVLLVSQVITDFGKEIRANIRTQIQLWTRDEDELARIKDKFGKRYMQSVARSKVGTGMVFNSDWNKGRPYFIHFRPIKHHVSKLSDEEIIKFDERGRKLDNVKKKMRKLEEKDVDVFDLKIEVDLAERKLEEGSFDVVDLYLESVAPRVEEACEKHSIKIEEERELVSEKELEKARAMALKELEEATEREEEERKKQTPLMKQYEQETGESARGEDGELTKEYKKWRKKRRKKKKQAKGEKEEPEEAEEEAEEEEGE